MGGDLSLESLQKDVASAAEDFREALTTHDFSKVLQDLQDDAKKRGPKDNGFEQGLDKALHDKGLLPRVFLEGLDDKGNIAFKDVKGNKFALDKQGKATDGRVPLEVNFAKVLDHFHPVRPPGIGGFEPGVVAAKSKDQNQDWRSGKTTSNPDKSTDYEYKGQLAWAGGWGGGQSNVGFTASEKTDSTGKLLETHVKYDKPIHQTFLGPDGKIQHRISDVRQVDTTIDKDGNYVTTVTAAGGKVTFKTNSDGKILEIK